MQSRFADSKLGSSAILLVGLMLVGCSEDDSRRETEDAGVADMAGQDGGSTVDAGVDMAPEIPHPYADSLFLSDTFLNIAHRGGGRLAPEETMEAYQNALAHGAHVIECDVHTTSDGVVVCIHDSQVGRTTDGTGAVHSMTFEEVRELDAGYQFTTDGGMTFPYRGQGVKIATLDEMFEAFPDTYIAVEIKQEQPAMIEEFLAVVDEHDAESKIVVASFSLATITALREARPDIITGLSLNEMVEFARLNEETEADYLPPGLVMQAPFEQATDELVARAHRLGMRVQVWTVNDRTIMEDMIAIGVDGIFTDDPELLQQILSE